MSVVKDILQYGTHAARPAAAATNDGKFYRETDTGSTYQSNGSTWVLVGSGSSVTDSNAVHVNAANEISGITEKTTLANDDLFIIEDSAASGVKKKVKKSNLGAGGGASITEGVYGSIPAGSDNDVYLATDGQLLNHKASGAWYPFGPVPKLTLPAVITGAATTLNNGGTMGAGDTSCTITSATGFPAAPFFILIESEVIRVGARSGTALSSLTRGYNGTSGASHADGTAVTLKNWIWANQGTSTVDQSMGPTVMQSQLASGQTLRALYCNAPATPYTITALVCRENREHINYIGCGICFRENSSGKFISLGPSEADGAYAFEVMKWNSTTSYTTAYKSGGSSQGILPWNWIQIKDDGSSLYFYTSGSGLPGTFIQFYTNTRNNFFTTGPDGIGMMLYQENNTAPNQSTASFWHWAVS